MKLSNKILLGFFGFAFVYLTAAFTELRLTGTSNLLDDNNSIAETVDLSGIAYVILNDLDNNIHITGSDRPQLEVRSFSGGWLKNLTYKVSGDTLTLSGLRSEDTKSIRISVFLPKTGLKGITVKGAVAIVRGFEPDLLRISQNAGSVWVTESQIAKLEMDLDKSYLDISGTVLDTVSATIEKSNVNISSPVGLMQGSIKTASFLRLGDIREIQLKKDVSSRVNMYQ